MVNDEKIGPFPEESNDSGESSTKASTVKTRKARKKKATTSVDKPVKSPPPVSDLETGKSISKPPRIGPPTVSDDDSKVISDPAKIKRKGRRGTAGKTVPTGSKATAFQPGDFLQNLFRSLKR